MSERECRGCGCDPLICTCVREEPAPCSEIIDIGAALKRLDEKITRRSAPREVAVHRTYNPSTHRLVPRDAVVLEPKDAAMIARDLASLCRRLNDEHYRAGPGMENKLYAYWQGVIQRKKCLRSALASAQGNEEGNDGDAR